jgi:hypothetical protein
MTLVEKFTAKYGKNPITLVEEANLKNFGRAKSMGLEKLLSEYVDTEDIILVNNEFLKELVECFAEAGEKFPENLKASIESSTEFEIPNKMVGIPKSKGTLENFKDIVGNDDLRPVMSGVFVSEDGKELVGTDAHKLAVLKTTEYSEYAGKIIDLTKYIKSKGKIVDFIVGKYPNYNAVIPKELPYEEKGLVTYSFYNYVKSAIEVKRLIDTEVFSINLNLMTDTSGETTTFSFGYNILFDAFNFAMLNGWDDFTMRYSERNRAMVLDFGDDNIILVMPLLANKEYSSGTIALTPEEITEKYRLGLTKQKSSKPAKSTKPARTSAPVSSEPFKKFDGDLADTTYIPRREIASITLRNGDVLSGNDVIDGFYRVNKKMAQGGGVEQDEPYSKYLYTEKDWESIKRFLQKTYTPKETDIIMRSKWMRKIGRKENFKNFVLFFNEYKRYLDQMLEEEEKESSHGVSMYSNIKVEQDEPYSKYLYTEKDWESIKKFLEKTYTPRETDIIMRSKWMRKIGRKENFKNFVLFYNEYKRYLDQMLEEEGEYAHGGSMYADGGSISKYSIDGYDLERLQESGMTIKEIDKLLMKAFPYSFGFELFPFKDDSFSTYRYLIPNTDNYKGIQDESLKLSFDKFHRMTYRVFQGEENTYFYFMLDGNDDKSYIGTFGFKDRGDVSKEYVTSFIALLTKLYGFPFKVSHEVYGQGGSMYADGGLINYGGGKIDAIDMEEVEKSAIFYTEEGKWTPAPTIEKFEYQIYEYQEMKRLLDNKEIRPSRVIGTGYKPQSVRPLAYRWIEKQILIAKRAIEILKERMGGSMYAGGGNMGRKKADSFAYYYVYASFSGSGFDLYQTEGNENTEIFLGNFKTIEQADKYAESLGLERRPISMRFAHGGSMSSGHEVGDTVTFNSVMGGTKTGTIISKMGEEGFRVQVGNGFATIKKSAIV